MRIEVECERTQGTAELMPRSFRLGDRQCKIIQVTDRWFGGDHTYYRVRTDDDQLYVIRHDEPDDVWELAAYTSAARAQAIAPPDGATPDSAASRRRH